MWVGGCVTAPSAWPHRQGGGAGVYTDWLEWPLGAVLGYSCTLLRCELRQVTRAPQPPWRASGASSLVPLAWSGRQALSEWRRCQAGIFAEASTHTNPRRASKIEDYPHSIDIQTDEGYTYHIV